MKKLLRSQMKNVIGGVNYESGSCKCANGTAASGGSCYFDTTDCTKTCGCSYTCKDQANETGSKCVAST